jgi:hypothetical protein
LRGLLALLLFPLLTASAHACLFAKDARPQDWNDWATVLFAADVIGVEQDVQKSLDVITVRVAETFKGPPASSATLQVPSRLWTSCRLERPAVGAHVLVALNANNDTLLVPLTSAYAALLKKHPF